jgi:hypothetical protein
VVLRNLAKVERRVQFSYLAPVSLDNLIFHLLGLYFF